MGKPNEVIKERRIKKELAEFSSFSSALAEFSETTHKTRPVMEQLKAIISHRDKMQKRLRNLKNPQQAQITSPKFVPTFGTDKEKKMYNLERRILSLNNQIDLLKHKQDNPQFNRNSTGIINRNPRYVGRTVFTKSNVN